VGDEGKRSRQKKKKRRHRSQSLTTGALIEALGWDLPARWAGGRVLPAETQKPRT
jgi:hypothetical protein